MLSYEKQHEIWKIILMNGFGVVYLLVASDIGIKNLMDD